MLLNFAIHRRQNETHWKSTGIKTIHIHNVVSHCRLMQYACRSVTLVSPLIFFQRGSYNNNSLGTFWQNTAVSYCRMLYKLNNFDKDTYNISDVKNKLLHLRTPHDQYKTNVPNVTLDMSVVNPVTFRYHQHWYNTLQHTCFISHFSGEEIRWTRFRLWVSSSSANEPCNSSRDVGRSGLRWACSSSLHITNVFQDLCFIFI
jgi:hypothetical protein